MTADRSEAMLAVNDSETGIVVRFGRATPTRGGGALRRFTPAGVEADGGGSEPARPRVVIRPTAAPQASARSVRRIHAQGVRFMPGSSRSLPCAQRRMR